MSEWISVNDRLPDDSCGEYILTFDPFGKIRMVPVWSFHKLQATHWMPLPEPPK